MTDPRRATFLVNPAARGVEKRLDADRAVRYLRKRGLEVELRTPASPLEMTALAATSAERGDELLFVAGGDGSLRDAARGLAGSNTALAPVPAGTVNVFAREVGLPLGVRTAIDAHLTGRVVRIDLGRAGEQPFLLMASAGWDAAIVGGVSLGLKRRMGDLAYAVKAAKALPGMRTRPARWEVGDEVHEGPLALMVVSNTRLYGGRLRFSPLALADDGLLDVVALCPRGLPDALRMSARIVMRRAAHDRHALSARAASIRIETPGIPVQLDGDYAGETPMAFAVDPGALAVSIPAGPSPEILSD
ncbi:MAG: diacylglycerol kinase family protein [Dehalococcoidia bacterium]